jgi:hypothetical protein
VYLVVVLALLAHRTLWTRVLTILDGRLQNSCVRESYRRAQGVHGGLGKLHAGERYHQNGPDVHIRLVEPYRHSDCGEHDLMDVPRQAARAVATSMVASPALWAGHALVCQLTQVEVCVCPRVEEALRKQTRLECSRAICQGLYPGTMASLRVVRAASKLIERLHVLWARGLDLQAKVQNVSVRYLQISVLVVAGSRCCIKRISVKLMTVA